MEKRRVVLYGKSIILGTVGASLKRCSDLEIVPLAPPLPTAAGLDELAPDVIIFDLDAAYPQSALSLLQTRPRLLLVGIDPATDEMLLWSGEHSRAMNMQDLARTVGSRADPVRAPDAWAQRLRRLGAGWSVPVLSRGQKLAFALGTVLLVAGLAALLVSGQASNPPLVGTVTGSLAPETALAFLAGFLLGAFVLWGWFRMREK